MTSHFVNIGIGRNQDEGGSNYWVKAQEQVETLFLHDKLTSKYKMRSIEDSKTTIGGTNILVL